MPSTTAQAKPTKRPALPSGRLEMSYLLAWLGEDGLIDANPAFLSMFGLTSAEELRSPGAQTLFFAGDYDRDRWISSFAGGKEVQMESKNHSLVLNADAVAKGKQTDLDELGIAKNAREEKLAARKKKDMTPEELHHHQHMEKLYRQQVLKEQPTIQIQGLGNRICVMHQAGQALAFRRVGLMVAGQGVPDRVGGRPVLVGPGLGALLHDELHRGSQGGLGLARLRFGG